MCEGRPSMLMTYSGQMIADELSNSHAKMAEKYFGDSADEDKCFQPELEIERREIKVNSEVCLRMDKTKDINEKHGKAIVDYFNKNYGTVVKLRAAVLKCKTAKPDKLFAKNWRETWSYFPRVLNEETKNYIYGADVSELVNKYKILTNSDGDVKLLAAVEASKDKKNLSDIWRNPKPFKLSDIYEKGGSNKLFAE